MRYFTDDIVSTAFLMLCIGSSVYWFNQMEPNTAVSWVFCGLYIFGSILRVGRLKDINQKLKSGER